MKSIVEKNGRLVGCLTIVTCPFCGASGRKCINQPALSSALRKRKNECTANIINLRATVLFLYLISKPFLLPYSYLPFYLFGSLLLLLVGKNVARLMAERNLFDKRVLSLYVMEKLHLSIKAWSVLKPPFIFDFDSCNRESGVESVIDFRTIFSHYTSDFDLKGLIYRP